MKLFIPVMFALSLTGCATTFTPRSVAESESGYTYIPVDPFAVKTIPGDSCENIAQANSNAYGPLLQALPDNAVRMLIERFNASGSVTYGPAKFGAKGESYRVTVDYINADTINVPVWISKRMETYSGEIVPVSLLAPVDRTPLVRGTETYVVTRQQPLGPELKEYVEYNIPVYIGIGLRVAAVVDITGGKANISGIGVLGAEAEAEKLKGSLIVQTLGVNGKSIAAALPIQSELNRTTAQNAIVAVGSIKALLYDAETSVSPRVVGIYLPFPGGKPLVNALISELSKERVPWPRPCFKLKSTTTPSISKVVP